MARNFDIAITGDPSGAIKAFGQTQKAAEQAGKSIERSFSGSGSMTAMQQLGRAGTSVAQTVGRALVGAARGAGRAFVAVGRELGQTVAAGAQIATAAIAAIGTYAIRAGFEYNQLGQASNAALTAILGTRDAAADLMGQVVELGSTSPFPRQVLIDATRDMVAFGMESDNVIPTLDAMQQAIAAVGGGEPEFQRLTLAIGQIQSIGHLTGNEMRQMAELGVPAAQILAEEFGITGDELGERISAGAIDADTAIQTLSEGIQNRFGGATDELFGTITGGIGGVKAALRDLGSAIVEPFVGFVEGGAIVEALNNVRTGLRNFIEVGTDGSTRLAGALEPLNGILENIAGKVETAGQAFEDAMGALGDDALDGIVSALSDLAPLLAGVGAGFMTAFARNLPIIGTFLGGLNPIVLAIGALIAASEPLREHFVTTFGRIMDALEPLMGPLGDLGVKLVEIIEAVGLPIMESFADILIALSPVALALADALLVVMEALAPIIVLLASELAQAIEQVAPLFVDLFEGLAPLIGDVLQALMPFIEALAEIGTAQLVSAMENLLPVLLEVAEILAGALIESLDALAPLLEEIGPLVQDFMTNQWEELVPVLPPLAEALADLAVATAELLVALMPIIVPLTKFTMMLSGNSLRGAVQIISWLAEGLGILTRMGSPAVETFRGLGRVWELMKDAAAGMWDVVGNILGWLIDRITSNSGHFERLRDIAVEVFRFIATVVVSVIGGIVIGIVLLVSNFSTGVLIPNFLSFKDSALTVFNIVKDAVVGAWDNFIFPALSALGRFIVGTVIPIVVRLATWVVERFKQIRDAVVSAWNNFIRPALQSLWRFILETVIPAVIRFANAARERFEQIRNAVVSAWENYIRPAVRALVNFINDQIIPRMRYLWSEVIRPVWDNIRNKLKGAWDFIKDRVFDPMKTFVTETIPSAFRSLRDAIGRIMGSIRRGISSAWQTIVRVMRGPINTVIGFINRIISGVNTVLDKLPGLSGNLRPIRELGAGSSGSGSGDALSEAAMARAASGARIGPGFLTNGPQVLVGEGRPQYPEYVIPTDPQHRNRAQGLAANLIGDIGMPQMAIGGVIGGVSDAVSAGADWVSDRVGDGVSWMREELAEGILGPINTLVKNGLDNMPNVMHMQDVAQGARQKVWDWVKGVDREGLDEKAIMAGLEGSGGSGPGGGVQRWAGVSRRALTIEGIPHSWLGDLLTQMQHESGGNPSVVNRWDSNWTRGTPSVGLMQVIGPTYRAYRHPSYDTGPYAYGTSMNPLSNILAAIRYTTSRYGSLGRWRAGGFKGYATGGIVDGNGGTVHPREMVLTQSDQKRLMQQIRTGRGGGDGVSIEHVTINIGAGANEADGRRAGKAFLDTVARHRVQTKARIS